MLFIRHINPKLWRKNAYACVFRSGLEFYNLRNHTFVGKIMRPFTNKNNIAIWMISNDKKPQYIINKSNEFSFSNLI